MELSMTEMSGIAPAAIGARIKSCCNKKGLSLVQLQERLGLASVQAIYHWIHGTCVPSVDNLVLLSRILGVSIDYILTGAGE